MDNLDIYISSKASNNLTDESLKLVINTNTEVLKGRIDEQAERIKEYKEDIKYYRRQIEKQELIIQSLRKELSDMYNKQTHLGSGDIVGRDKNITNIYNPHDLTQIAEDIQVILEQLDKNYDLNVNREKMALAIEVSQHIEDDKNLTKRIVNALKTGSISALESLLDHPAASFLIAALEDWKQTKK